jgi:hypothetical protein
VTGWAALAIGRNSCHIWLPGGASSRDLVGELLRLNVWRHPKLALQCFGAALVLSESLCTPSSARIGADECALSNL